MISTKAISEMVEIKKSKRERVLYPAAGVAEDVFKHFSDVEAGKASSSISFEHTGSGLETCAGASV